MSNVLKLSSMPVYDESPFNEALITKLNKTGRTKFDQFIAMGNKEVVDKSTGEVSDGGDQILMGKRRVVDEDEFAKIYSNELRRHLNASKGDMEMVFYFASIMEYNVGHVWFDLEHCIENTNLSEGTIYRSLANLCKAGVIARSNRHYKYFINPIVMFKGDRVVVVQEYVRVGSAGMKKPRKLSEPKRGSGKNVQVKDVVKEAVNLGDFDMDELG